MKIATLSTNNNLSKNMLKWNNGKRMVKQYGYKH